MSILDSSIAPFLFMTAGVAVLAGFFRKTLVKLLIFFAVEVLFMALFPKMLLSFVHLVTKISTTLIR
jgi:hypothetical protein